MRNLLAFAVVMSLAAVAPAGEVKIGMDPMGMHPKRCHVAHFVGPSQAIAAYEKRQKERFEPADPAVIERMKTEVSVAVTMDAPKERTGCTLQGARPEKLVLAEKTSTAEPVLMIPLEAQEGTLQNLAGANLAVFSAFASVPLASIEKLVGRELEVHIVFSGSVQKELWKKDYAAKILK